MKLDELDIPEASPIELLKRKMSPVMNPGQYEKAAETMYNILQRKREENGGKFRHGLGYYAMQIGRSFNKVDYRALMNVFAKKYADEFPELINELKIEIPDDEGMGIPRSRMPQIKSKDYPEFIDYLADTGATFEKESVPAKSLKPVQKEFSKKGVEKQMQKYSAGEKRKPVIASADNYIMDGHHRWLVALNTGATVDIFRVNKPGKELLDLLLKFPKVYFKDIYNEDDISEEPMVAKQSHIFHVVSTIADRKDDKPFPIKFYDGGTMEVKPSTAKRIIDLYYRAEDKVKQQIMQYMPTYNGFKEIAKAAGTVQESAGVGKITKQNSTPDVKPGETERQAKKFFGGNGKPKPLGVKGATPNQAFNLGLTEDNISHVGTERGRSARKKGIKPGTDAWFKHWFSLPLMKREHVEMAKAELVEHVRLVRENDGKDYMHGYCHQWALNDIEKNPERVLFARIGWHQEEEYEEVDHVFTVDPGTGKAYDVRGEFASVEDLLKDYDYGADEIDVQQVSKDDIKHWCNVGELKPLDENFKDGKKPGRKGLSKRVGVDCSKPVGELRKIAKNSSGEKQRMAHWCANMKSGRKK